MKFVLSIVFIIFASLAVSAQTDVNAQRLAKVLDLLEKTEAELKAERAITASQGRLIDTQVALLDIKDAVIKAKDQEIASLRALKCETTQFFWVYKKKRCR